MAWGLHIVFLSQPQFKFNLTRDAILNIYLC